MRDVRTMPYANTTDATIAHGPAADEAAGGMEAAKTARVEAARVKAAKAEAVDEECFARSDAPPGDPSSSDIDQLVAVELAVLAQTHRGS